VHDADGISDEDMAAFARWTNLSETTFLLTPTTDEADYRLRIFTPGQELPFAGHPTIGSAHAWLEGGGVPRTEGTLVQECGAGLVQLRRASGGHGRLAFAGPPVVESRIGYWIGLLYLGIVASAVAFALYYRVIRAVGPAQAAYSSVLIPILAMAISTAVENYRWSALAAGGGVLALAGMAVALRAGRAPAPLLPPTD